MKSVFISMLVLLTLVSCDSSSKKEERSEDCSINGQKVDCSAFRAREKKGIVVTAIMEAKYEIKDEKLKVLAAEGEKEIFKKEVKETADGSYTCITSFPANQEIEIIANERELILSYQGQAITYGRTNKSSLDRSHYEWGTFKVVDHENDAEDIIKLNSSGHITLTTACYF